jgi:hypothetical protein
MGILTSVGRDFARWEALGTHAARDPLVERARLSMEAAPAQRGAAAAPHAWPLDPSRFGSPEVGAKLRAIAGRTAAKPAPKPQE